MNRTRRNYLGVVGTAALTGFSGCTNITSDIGLTHPISEASWSTVDENVAIEGQPTVEDGIPTVGGAIAHTPKETQDLIDWDRIINSTDDSDRAPSELTDFDAKTGFVTVIIGVLPYGYALRGLNPNESDIHFEGEVIRNEVTSFRSFGSGKEEPPSKHTYDYTITLWDLNGSQKPTTIEVNYHE